MIKAGRHETRYMLLVVIIQPIQTYIFQVIEMSKLDRLYF